MRMLKYTLIASLLLGIGHAAQAVTVNLFQIQGKALPLYAEPTTNAKAVANLQKGQQVVGFYQQNDWLKIADPSNGQVGWVKVADLQQTTSNAGNMQSVIISDNNKNGSAQQMQVLQYSNTNTQPLTTDQAQALLKKIKNEQQQIQQQVDKNITDAFKNLSITSEMFKSLDAAIDTQIKSMTSPTAAQSATTGNTPTNTQQATSSTEQKK